MSSSAASSSAPSPALARPAATLVVLRDGPGGLEVLLLLRAERGDHNSGAWVFPGGLVDAGDCSTQALCAGLDDEAASRALQLESGGLAYVLAALRECFEECGLLFAVDARGAAVSAEVARELQAWRGGLHRGERTLAEFARETGLRFDATRLAYLSHWLTPLGHAKRFDARFFIAEAPAEQAAMHDGIEMTAHRWMRPADALAAHQTLKLMGPTRHTLQTLVRFTRSAEALAWARSPREVPRMFPRMGVGRAGRRPVMPGELAWAELGKLDPHGRGEASYEITAEQPVRLSERVIRVTAANPGVMTGPGTNSYLVGGGAANEWAVIDPGPLDEAHLQALIDAAPGPIRRIFATHTHSDHSPGATLLKARTGAITLGRIAAHAERQDASFAPDQPLQGGERIALAEHTTLRVLHTPGHASNHLCYLLEEEKLLFTGDHVMQASTVVINPPDGDMGAYLASLRALLRDEIDHIEWLAPGHGFLMESPRRALEWIVAHRLEREAKVRDALHALGPANEAVLLPRVYDDVPVAMHGMAARSLLAHLLKLRGDGEAVEHEGRWGLR